jgi:hypothetical protein
MPRHRDIRAQRRAKRDLWTDTEPVEIPNEDEADERIPIGPLDCAPIPMREGPAIDPRAPWPFPT